MPKVGIININMGNIASVFNAFQILDFDVEILESPEEITKVDRLVLPGVGAFPMAMENLGKAGFLSAIQDFTKAGKPVLGICLGMQLLFQTGFEFTETSGLGLIDGTVIPLASNDVEVRLPHVGWNNVSFINSKLAAGIPEDSCFYFVHSFNCEPASEEYVTGITTYGRSFCSVVEKDLTFGVQFHPEKSSAFGLKLLKKFGELSW